MKQIPNISIQKKSNTKLDYLKYLATENIQPNITAPTIFTSNTKTKSKPKINVQKGIDINKVNKLRTDILNYSINELGIHPDLLIEYSTHYVLTITTYTILSGIETLTAKDFDIYLDGIKLDTKIYSVTAGENIIITLQKDDEANVTILQNQINESSFDIVGKFILK